MLYLAFALFVIPSLFFVIVWATVTICRICFPHKSLPFDKYLDLAAPEWETSKHRLSVGVRDIQRAQQRRQENAPFHYIVEEPTSRVPERWRKELWHRRN